MEIVTVCGPFCFHGEGKGKGLVLSHLYPEGWRVRMRCELTLSLIHPTSLSTYLDVIGSPETPSTHFLKGNIISFQVILLKSYDF